MKDLNIKVQQFFDKVEDKEFNSYEEMLKFGKENAKVYDCVALHLDEQLRPEIQLSNNSECPNADMKGQCHGCEYMVNVLTEDGSIFAFGTYDLVCAY